MTKIWRNQMNLSPGESEQRKYTFHYADGDQPVGGASELFHLVTSGQMAG